MSVPPVSADPYVWFDPFEEVDRWKRSAERAHGIAARAREDGRNEVMEYIGDAEKSRFMRAVHDAVGDMCTNLANDIVRPAILESYADALTRKRIVEQQLRVSARQIIQPMFTRAGGAFRLSMPDGVTGEAPEIRVEVHTLQAFQYTIHLPAEDYR